MLGNPPAALSQKAAPADESDRSVVAASQTALLPAGVVVLQSPHPVFDTPDPC